MVNYEIYNNTSSYKNILPSLANEFITLVKESSIISVIGVVEIMRTADIVKMQHLEH